MKGNIGTNRNGAFSASAGQRVYGRVSRLSLVFIVSYGGVLQSEGVCNYVPNRDKVVNPMTALTPIMSMV